VLFNLAVVMLPVCRVEAQVDKPGLKTADSVFQHKVRVSSAVNKL